MNSFEFNKIFAAVLTAGIVAMLGGFIAKQMVHAEIPAEDAIPIEGAVGGTAGAAAGPTGPQPVMALIAAADVAKGEKLSKACAACHSFEAGGPNKVGPNLHAILGHAKASVAGFEYSSALKALGGQWDYDALNHFLYKPKDYVAGTKMNFAGLKKAEDRAALIAWLRTQGSSMGLPSEAEIKAEEAAMAPPAAAEEAPADAAAAATEGAEKSAADAAASEAAPAAH